MLQGSSLFSHREEDKMHFVVCPARLWHLMHPTFSVLVLQFHLAIMLSSMLLRLRRLRAGVDIKILGFGANSQNGIPNHRICRCGLENGIPGPYICSRYIKNGPLYFAYAIQKNYTLKAS